MNHRTILRLFILAGAAIGGAAIGGCAGPAASTATDPGPSTRQTMAASSAAPLATSAAAHPAKDFRFQSDFKVVIDDAAATDNHVEPASVNQRVKKFIDTHDRFSLADLQNIKIPNSDGRDVLLQEVASVQVEFHRAGK
jgi:hypothetical protein